VIAKPFATEADLCAAFLAAIGADWTAYAETAGWDVLLSRKSDGFQIGIEAKLRLNANVISQAIEEYGAWSAENAGPDCRAVLVPAGDAGGFSRIAAYIGLTIIRVTPQQSTRRYGYRFDPALPVHGQDYACQHWHEWVPAKRHKLPEYVPDVAAGASAPLQLTTWKIAALKIVATIEQRGYVTRADFKHFGIDHRRWLAAETKWLQNVGGRYVAGDRIPNFKAQHPKVYEQIVGDAPKWMPKAAPDAPQLALGAS
jgi:hypothetical protein